MKLIAILSIWMNTIVTMSGLFVLLNDPNAYGMYFAIVLAFLCNAWIISSLVDHCTKYGIVKNGKDDTGRRTLN